MTHMQKNTIRVIIRENIVKKKTVKILDKNYIII